jgi:hypothetical protein
VAVIFLQEVFALDAVALGKTQQAALERVNEALVDVIELLDQRSRCGWR